MNIEFISVVMAVFSLLLLAVPGFVLQKVGLFNNKASDVLSNIVLYFCQAAMLFMGFQGCSFTPGLLINIFITAGLSLFLFGLCSVLAFVLIKNKKDSKVLRVVRCASVFGNCGFMGIPFLMMLFKNEPQSVIGEILIYSSILITVFNIFNWTVGVYFQSQDKKQISIKKILFNPVIITIIISMLLFFIIQKPLVDVFAENSILDRITTEVMDCLNVFSDMVTPLSMMVIGIKLASVNLKQLFCNKWAYLACFLRLIAFSTIGMFTVAFLPISIVIKYVVFFLFSMPCAASTVMFAVKFDSDSQTASVIVVLSTILSIATISVMFLAFSGLLSLIG